MQTGHETTPLGGEGQRAPYGDFTEMPSAGVWRPGRSGERIADKDPYTGVTLLEIPLASAADVNEAYEEAGRLQPAWAAVRPEERRNLLLRAAIVLQRRREEVIDWLIRESGSTRIKA